MQNMNLFKLCSALRVLGYFMILLFAAIVILTYYAVVFVTWGPHLFPLSSSTSFFSAFFILLLFHTLLFLLTWSYFMAVFNDPGSVPLNWTPLPQLPAVAVAVPPPSNEVQFELEEEEEAPSTTTPSTVGYCTRCQNAKPPRCHHCSICKFLLTFFFLLSYQLGQVLLLMLLLPISLLQVKGVFLRWIIIAFGSSIALGHEPTSIFFSSWYLSFSSSLHSSFNVVDYN